MKTTKKEPTLLERKLRFYAPLSVLPNGPVSCDGCGACCVGLEVPVHPLDSSVPPEMVNRLPNGFGTMKQRGDKSCVAFNRKTKRCTIYEDRPLVCVEYVRGGRS